MIDLTELGNQIKTLQADIRVQADILDELESQEFAYNKMIEEVSDICKVEEVFEETETALKQIAIDKKKADLKLRALKTNLYEAQESFKEAQSKNRLEKREKYAELVKEKAIAVNELTKELSEKLRDLEAMVGLAHSEILDNSKDVWAKRRSQFCEPNSISNNIPKLPVFVWECNAHKLIPYNQAYFPNALKKYKDKGTKIIY